MSLEFFLPTLLAAVVLFWLHLRAQRKVAYDASAPSSPVPEPEPLVISAEPDEPIGLGVKNLWIAARASDADAVAEALGLQNCQPANWQSGYRAAYAVHGGPSAVFVTPPLEGWVLAIGRALPDPSNPALLDGWRRMMARASHQLGEVLFFATHRVSSYSAWAVYRQGEEVRLFAWADEPIYDSGAALPEEEALIAKAKAAWEAGGQGATGGFCWMPEEEDVLRLAELWSLDPSALDARDLPSSVGRIGTISLGSFAVATSGE